MRSVIALIALGVVGCSSYSPPPMAQMCDIKSEMGILWDDKDLKISWPNNRVIISTKDKKNYTFKNFVDTKKFKKVKW